MGNPAAEEAQGRIFEFLAGAHQPGHLLAGEVLGETIERQGEFDEGVEDAAFEIVLPAPFQGFRNGE